MLQSVTGGFIGPEVRLKEVCSRFFMVCGPGFGNMVTPNSLKLTLWSSNNYMYLGLGLDYMYRYFKALN